MVAMMMASGLKISTTHILHHRRPYGRSRSVIVGSGQDWWKFPRLEKTGGVPSPSLSLSDILWPSAGAFAAMAALGRLDQMIAHKGVTFTIAPLGAVCAVLFTTPSSPAAKRKNMFMAQIACGLFGVLALAAFGPGWVARSFGVAASVAFMITTGAVHPPAASLPILFIDAAKFHQLQFWYLLFPGATGCVLLCLVQEMVFYMKANFRWIADSRDQFTRERLDAIDDEFKLYRCHTIKSCTNACPKGLSPASEIIKIKKLQQQKKSTG